MLSASCFSCSFRLRGVHINFFSFKCPVQRQPSLLKTTFSRVCHFSPANRLANTVRSNRNCSHCFWDLSVVVLWATWLFMHYIIVQDCVLVQLFRLWLQLGVSAFFIRTELKLYNYISRCGRVEWNPSSQRGHKFCILVDRSFVYLFCEV